MNFYIPFCASQLKLLSFFFHRNYSYFYLMHTSLLFWETFDVLKFFKKFRRKQRFFKKSNIRLVRMRPHKTAFLRQPLDSFFLPKKTNHHLFMNAGSAYRPPLPPTAFILKSAILAKKARSRRRLKSKLFKNRFLLSFSSSRRAPVLDKPFIWGQVGTINFLNPTTFLGPKKFGVKKAPSITFRIRKKIKKLTTKCRLLRHLSFAHRPALFKVLLRVTSPIPYRSVGYIRRVVRRSIYWTKKRKKAQVFSKLPLRKPTTKIFLSNQRYNLVCGSNRHNLFIQSTKRNITYYRIIRHVWLTTKDKRSLSRNNFKAFKTALFHAAKLFRFRYPNIWSYFILNLVPRNSSLYAELLKIWNLNYDSIYKHMVMDSSLEVKTIYAELRKSFDMPGPDPTDPYSNSLSGYEGDTEGDAPSRKILMETYYNLRTSPDFRCEDTETWNPRYRGRTEVRTFRVLQDSKRPNPRFGAPNTVILIVVFTTHLSDSSKWPTGTFTRKFTSVVQRNKATHLPTNSTEVKPRHTSPRVGTANSTSKATNPSNPPKNKLISPKVLTRSSLIQEITNYVNPKEITKLSSSKAIPASCNYAKPKLNPYELPTSSAKAVLIPHKYTKSPAFNSLKKTSKLTLTTESSRLWVATVQLLKNRLSKPRGLNGQIKRTDSTTIRRAASKATSTVNYYTGIQPTVPLRLAAPTNTYKPNIMGTPSSGSKPLRFNSFRRAHHVPISKRSVCLSKSIYIIWDLLKKSSVNMKTCTNHPWPKKVSRRPRFSPVLLKITSFYLPFFLYTGVSHRKGYTSTKKPMTKVLRPRRLARITNGLQVPNSFIKKKWFFISRMQSKTIPSHNSSSILSRKIIPLPSASYVFSKHNLSFILRSQGLKFYKHFKFKFKKQFSYIVWKSYYSFLKINELKKFTFDLVKKKLFSFLSRRVNLRAPWRRTILSNNRFFSFFKTMTYLNNDSSQRLFVSDNIYRGVNVDQGNFPKSLIEQHTTRELFMPRIKFKPGYMRIWRHFRLAFAEAINFKYIYQQQLTRHLSRFSRRINQQYLQFWENNIVCMFIYSQLIPDENTFNLFFSKNFLYLNSYAILSKQLSVYPNDFLQVVVSHWYYIFSRWLNGFLRLRHLKFRKLVFRKSATSRYKAMKRVKQKSFYTPNWIYYVKHDYLDIKSFFEVDFFTLSCFCVYDPMTFMYHSPRDFRVLRWHVLRLYNWKYIN